MNLPRLHLVLACLAVAALAVSAEEPKKTSPDDQYVLGPDSKAQEGVPKGELIKGVWKESKTYPGTIHNYTIYVPAQYDGKTPACLFVCQDNVQYNAPTVFDNLIAKKQMPVTLGLFIAPGYFQSKPGEPEKDAKGRPLHSDRSNEYDSLGDKYSRFLIDEMIPGVLSKYNLTDKPEGRCIAGASSGGICAFNVAWERPDYFRKVFTSIGSFTNIKGGGVFPELVRKADKKPIRIFQQDGSNDIVNQFGSWPEANRAMAAAWDEKGYDHKFVVGEGTHNPKHAQAIFPDAMRWMWRDWQGEPAK